MGKNILGGAKRPKNIPFGFVGRSPRGPTLFQALLRPVSSDCTGPYNRTCICYSYRIEISKSFEMSAQQNLLSRHVHKSVSLFNF